MTPPRNRVVLVTGAGSGLGQAAALLLAERGFTVYGSTLTTNEAAEVEHAARSRGTAIRPIQMDVTRRDEIDAAVATILQQAGRLDDVVQFAGMGLRGFFEDLDLEEIRAVYEVNVFGTMAVTQAVLPHMRRARSGRLVMVTSAAGRLGSMSISGYASSKFAVEGFAECLAPEVAPFGIGVSLVEPGLVMTPHFTVNRNRARRAVDPNSPYYAWFCQHESMADRLLQRGSITPRDVAETVHRILMAPRPRLRYLVGLRPRILVSLRRHLPGETFDRIYFGLLRRLVTSPRRQAAGLS